jgi:PASTA domain
MVLVALLVVAGCNGDDGAGDGPRLDTTRPSALDPDARRCAVDGADVRVPDVRGERLEDAIRIVEDAGLIVVGSGVPEGDPTDSDARVRAQEPPAGLSVPMNACMGFRTADVFED